MTLHEFLDQYCPKGPGEFRQLIRRKTGVYFPYPYIWRWCRRSRPQSVSHEHAVILQKATDGKCSLDELQNLRVIRERHGIAAARTAGPKVKPHVRAKETFAESKSRFLGTPGGPVHALTSAKAVAAPRKPKAKPKRKPLQSALVKRIAELESQLRALGAGTPRSTVQRAE